MICYVATIITDSEWLTCPDCSTPMTWCCPMATQFQASLVISLLSWGMKKERALAVGSASWA